MFFLLTQLDPGLTEIVYLCWFRIHHYENYSNSNDDFNAKTIHNY